MPNKYIARAAEVATARMMSVLPVVVVTGARQTGKSRMTKQLAQAAGHHIVTLDNLEVRAFAERAPAQFVRQEPRMLIDEVQRVPELLLAIKEAVDEEHQSVPGRFLVTGSANLRLMRTVSESLAGRAGYVTLYPTSRRERQGLGAVGDWTRLFESPAESWPTWLRDQSTPTADWVEAARTGGFPHPALNLDASGRADWYAGYEATLLERELREIRAVEDLSDFRRFMQALALRSGAAVNLTDISRDLGLPARNLRNWLEMLEVLYQVVRLPAYTRRRSARLRTRPKLYWVDSGLALHVARETAPRGVHLETMILTDLLAWAALDRERPAIYYWRDEANREVDFVIERAGRVVAIEIKATARPHPDDWKHLQHFRDEYRTECHGVLLLHGAKDVSRLGDQMVAAPWWSIT